MSRLLILFLIFAVILLGVVFHLRNDQLVVLDYLVGSSKFYLSVWLVSAFAIGAILGMISSIPAILKVKRENARLQRRVKVSEKEINNLRVLPMKDQH
jgi:putative membrane protein